MYKNIVIAYDGSEGSRLAFDKTMELIRALPDAKLSVIYVDEETGENIGFVEHPSTAPLVSPIADNARNRFIPPDTGEFTDPVNPPERAESYHYSKHIHQSIQQQLDAKGVDASVLALEGSAVKTITAFIEEQNVDLLVVGNSGKSGLQRFFVGSVSKRLLKEANCSILVVK